jgi:outer membrane protein TolC
LLDEYNAEYNRAVERAEALGQYGDFSGYAALYGDAAAAQMRYTWIMSNPEIALATGQITQQQYAQLALYKQYPALAMSGGYGGSGGSSGGSGDHSGDSDGTSSWTGGAVYNMGELIDAAAAGMTRAQIEQALTERGIDVTQPTVQADITTALSK